MSDIDHDKIITGPLPRGGLVFEFKEMERAVAFATAVKSRFNLDCRVFDDAEAAAASHPFFPWVQSPPVVHVDRPFWSYDPGSPQSKWDEGWQLERQIAQLAGKEFDGKFVET